MARRLRHPYGWQYDICQSMRRRYGQLPCNKIGNDERGSDEAELQLHCGKKFVKSQPRRWMPRTSRKVPDGGKAIKIRMAKQMSIAEIRSFLRSLGSDQAGRQHHPIPHLSLNLIEPSCPPLPTPPSPRRPPTSRRRCQTIQTLPTTTLTLLAVRRKKSPNGEK